MKHFTLILAFFATVALNATTSAQTTLSTAVDFTVTDLAGNTHNLFNYLDDGKYVCIDFYAFWCGPCMTTSPEFTDVYHQYGCNAGDVIFLAVEYEGTDADANEFEVSWSGDNPPPASSGADGGGYAVHATYGISAFPTYVLIAPSHQIVEQDIWPMDATILDNVLQSYDLSYMGCTNGVEEHVAEFAVYPVPATDVVNVELSEVGASIELINILGATVISTIVTESRTQLDVSALEVGSYFVRITEQGAVRTQAIQIVR